MKTIKLITACLISLTISNASFGQSELPELAVKSSTYKTAIGVRAGETSGLTVKQFIGGPNALEGIFGVWHHGLSATLLYERYAPAFNVSGMNWYYGIGGHAAFSTGRSYYYHRGHRHEYYRDGGFGLGIDGVFGLEYKVNNAPIAVSLDLKPYAEVVTNGGLWMSLDPGLGLKVVF